MPELQIAIDEADRDVLERVQRRLGLGTIEQAAEWLLKNRLRRSVRSASGHGRALYLVPREARQ